jgi:hypothetical protein
MSYSLVLTFEPVVALGKASTAVLRLVLGKDQHLHFVHNAVYVCIYLFICGTGASTQSLYLEPLHQPFL